MSSVSVGIGMETVSELNEGCYHLVTNAGHNRSPCGAMLILQLEGHHMQWSFLILRDEYMQKVSRNKMLSFS